MAEENGNTDNKWIEKLIRFFRQIPRKKPDTNQADYTGWNQSEADYQKEQAEWLQQVREQKQKKRKGDGERTE